MKNRKRSHPFRSFLLNGKVRTKLMCIYFVLILLPLGSFTLYAFQRINTVLQDQTLTAAGKAFQDAVAELESVMGKLDNVQKILTNDNLIYQMSSTDPLDYPLIQQFEDSNLLTTTLEQLIVLSGVDDIRLYVGNDFIYQNEGRHVFTLDGVKDSEWYSRLEERPVMQWFSPKDFADQPVAEQAWFSSMRILYDPSDIMEPLSILRTDVQAERVSAIIAERPVTEHGSLLLMQGDTVLLSSGQNGTGEFPPALLTQLAETAENIWATLSTDEGRFYVNSTPLLREGWRMVSIVPYDDIFQVSRDLQGEMLVVMLVIVASAYALAYFISKSTFHRLSQLSATMEAVERGDTGAHLLPVGNDEIGRLMNTFNSMMEQLGRLMEEKVRFGQEIKNLELKALQAQINPHFLYNTLDLINCISIEQNVPEIAETVTALADFYQISLSRGQDVITIEEELAHATAYLKIQALRFEGQLDVAWEVEAAVRECQIIKIVLQPIIENGVIHGIFERPDKRGRLRICGWLDGEDVYLSVSDNGVGMDAETLHSNFDPPPPGSIASPKGGYGIRNIDDRLRLAYGERYGLRCKSRLGFGTTVTIHIPKITASERP